MVFITALQLWDDQDSHNATNIGVQIGFLKNVSLKKTRILRASLFELFQTDSSFQPPPPATNTIRH